MEPLAKLLVAMLELAETELSMLKKSVIKLALSVGMLIGAAIFGITGLCWVLQGLFEQIVAWTHSRPLAYLIAGVLFLAAAGILAVLAFGGDKKHAKAAASGKSADDLKQDKKTDDQASLRIAG